MFSKLTNDERAELAHRLQSAATQLADEWRLLARVSDKTLSTYGLCGIAHSDPCPLTHISQWAFAASDCRDLIPDVFNV